MKILFIIYLLSLTVEANARSFTEEEAEIASEYEGLKREVLGLEASRAKLRADFNEAAKLKGQVQDFLSRRSIIVNEMQNSINAYELEFSRLNSNVETDTDTLTQINQWLDGSYFRLYSAKTLDLGKVVAKSIESELPIYHSKCQELKVSQMLRNLSRIRNDIKSGAKENDRLSKLLAYDSRLSSAIKLQIKADSEILKSQSTVINNSFKELSQKFKFPQICSSLSDITRNTNTVLGYLNIIQQVDGATSDAGATARSLFDFFKEIDQDISSIDQKREIKIFVAGVQEKYNRFVRNGDLLRANKVINSLIDLRKLATIRIESSLLPDTEKDLLMKETKGTFTEISDAFRNLEQDTKKLNIMAYRRSRIIAVKVKDTYRAGKIPANMISQADSYKFDIGRGKTLFKGSDFHDVYQYYLFLEKLLEVGSK